MIARTTLVIGYLVLLLAVSGIILAANPVDDTITLDPTATAPPSPTVAPIGPYRGYVPIVADTVSTPASMPSPTTTSPDATPTTPMSATPPPRPTDPPVQGTPTSTPMATMTTSPEIVWLQQVTLSTNALSIVCCLESSQSCY